MDNGYNLPDLKEAFDMIFKGISAEGKEKAPASKTAQYFIFRSILHSFYNIFFFNSVVFISNLS